MKKLKKSESALNQTIESYSSGIRGRYDCSCYCACPPPSVPNDTRLQLSADTSNGRALLVRNNS